MDPNIFEKGEKEEIMPEKEAAEKMMGAEKFIGILGDLMEKKREKEKRPRIILATYNRVGKGEFEGRINRPDLVLDILLREDAVVPPSESAAKKFFEKLREDWKNQLVQGEKGPVIILYGGSGDNFNRAASVIDDLSGWTAMLEEARKPQFFLLTCRCELEEKAKAVLPLIQAGRLNGLIYGEPNDCGGFKDLQKIVDSLLAGEKINA